ncbi:TetR/AcrR family transcriptional regulator [Mycobacterium sp. 1081908.1]|uniref:TetR/AcrR family transcriptional regulator n=1 Tax=Mycobacterium sp. 1081908.1 TaxID=1834066 RepID=UPI0007FBAE2E|nr:TetR/AcrR family transcriptional regulator [Mycobacterium sp. 1081908.1]OBK48174.1 TetR family transcriptional regulator [Mycobacterium sp. 1081908.1]
MPSPTPVTSAREAQRLQTRARLFDAAVAEIERSGLAGTDVAAIASAVGVARGTFYFHFPTKEHVLAELERDEESKIVAMLATEASPPGDLRSMLTSLVRQVLAAEERLGPVVFRDMLGLHFSATRPIEDELGGHPLAEFVIAAIAEAQAAQRVSPDADAGELGVIFLTGLFALLVTAATEPRSRAALLDRYVKTIVNGMEAS